MVFKLLPQSGNNQPNSVDGLLTWLDVSELGTLSRSNATAKSISDKARGGAVFESPTTKNQPRILQGRINDQTVVKFKYPNNYFVGPLAVSCSSITIFIVANGKITVDGGECEVIDNILRLPSSSYCDNIEFAELLIYDSTKITESDKLFIINYLTKKWIGHHDQS